MAKKKTKIIDLQKPFLVLVGLLVGFGLSEIITYSMEEAFNRPLRNHCYAYEGNTLSEYTLAKVTNTYHPSVMGKVITYDRIRYDFGEYSTSGQIRTDADFMDHYEEVPCGGYLAAENRIKIQELEKAAKKGAK